MDTGLSNSKALVSGGSGGIGAAIVRALLDEGATVAVLDRQPYPVPDNDKMFFIETDLRYEDAIVGSVRAASARLGGIDLFVNCAAVHRAEPIWDLSRGSWDEMLAVNLTSCALSCREVAREMLPRRRGSILVIGSTAVHTPGYRESGYRASKAGLKALVEVLAVELAPWGIRVNMLTPGAFPTGLVQDMGPQRRSATAENVPLGAREGRVSELQGAALLLLSDRLSSYTTGSEVIVDGGLHLRPIGTGDWRGTFDPTAPQPDRDMR